MVYHLIYASKAHTNIELNELQAILNVAEEFNAKNEISGILAFGREMFLQIIEGERKQLSALYAKILNDKRHTDVELIEFTEKPARHFPTWRMRLVRVPEALAQSDLLPSLKGRPFNPFELNAADAFALLRELSSLT